MKYLPTRQHPTVIVWDRSNHPLQVAHILLNPTKPVGLRERSLDFTPCMRNLCEDISHRCPDLYHVSMDRTLIAVTRSRNGSPHGLQARLTPLRCRGGMRSRWHGRVEYRVQRYVVDGQEMRYLLTFSLPRFLDQSFEEKLITVFHELYHISPMFDGDLRRHPGRYALHTRSRTEYDAAIVHLVRAYLKRHPRPEVYSFLEPDLRTLSARYASVSGVVVPRPRLLPVAEHLQSQMSPSR